MRIEGPAALPLRWGDEPVRFHLLYFHVGGQRWVAAYTGEITDGAPVPLRIESACVFGHVFRSAQCDCGCQLELAMRRFCRTGRGLLVYGIDQDGRGLGIESHFAIYRMRQQEEWDTDEIYRQLRAPVDARSYQPVAEILRHLGVSSVTLLTNNPRRESFLREQGFAVTTESLEAPLDVHNMSTLMLEKEDLDYRWSFETHADWLEPMQDGVSATPERSRARLVAPGRGVPDGLVAEAEDDGDWALARRLVAATPEPVPEGTLVVYLTDLPRVDELHDYVRTGAAIVVVPFANVPAALRTAEPALRVVDWARRNTYRVARPQWTPEYRVGDIWAYRRLDRLRLVLPDGHEPPAGLVDVLADGGARFTTGPVNWVEYPAVLDGAVRTSLGPVR